MDKDTTVEQVQCCGALEQLRERGFKEPFESRVQFHFGDEASITALWGINLFRVTGTGRLTRKGQKWICLNYCPFCGKRLREENDGEGQAETGDV